MSAKTQVLRCTTALALALNLSLAFADVTIEERISVEGMLKFANMSGKELTMVAGDRARTESDLQMESKLMRMFAGGSMGPTAEIIRLDQEKTYSLNLKKKEYSEQTFAEMRANWQKMVDQAQQAQAQAQAQSPQTQGSPAPVDQSQCEWSEPKSEVKRTGEKKTFAGYEAERISMAATQSCKDKKSGAVCDFTLNLDEWLSPALAEDAEITHFYTTYAEKMGFTSQMSRDAAQRAETLFGSYKGLWGELATKLRDVKGRPVKTTFGLSVGGPQCETTKGAPADASAGSATPAAPTSDEVGEAAATAAGQAAGEAAAQKAGESSLSGVAGKLGGKLGSLFTKKKAEPASTTATTAAPAPAAAAAPTTAPGMVSMMQMSVELVSINRGPASAGAFEVPAGFKKVGPQ
jgi:hypothetical protein